MIKNIIFDIGNVLVKFQPDQAMRDLGIDEVKIPKMAQATYLNPIWGELDRGVMQESEVIDEMVKVAPEYEAYVDHFNVILSRSKGQNLKMCLCSYNGMLTSTISSVMKDTKLQKAFYRYLVANDIPVTIESNGVYYE